MKRLMALLGCLALLVCLPSCASFSTIATILFGLPTDSSQATPTETTATTAVDPAAGLSTDGWYYYNGLPDNMQENYLSLYLALQESRTADHDITEHCVDGETDERIIGIYQNLPQSISSVEEMELLYHALLDDHPEFFYVSHFAYESLVYDDNDPLYFSMSLIFFLTAEERKAARIELEAAVDELTADLKDSELSDYEKELILHDRLLARCEYDEAAAEEDENGETIADNPTSHSSYGALCKGLAVCDGYTHAMLLLLREVGVQTVPVYNDDHAWNLVWIDNQPYHLDATWNDSDEIIQHNYFNLTTEDMARTREIAEQLPPLPHCTATDANYYTVNGTDLPDSSPETVSAVIAAAMQTGSSVIELRFSPDSYADGLAYIEGDALFDDIYWLVPDSILESWSSFFYIYAEDVCTVTLFL